MVEQSLEVRVRRLLRNGHVPPEHELEQLAGVAAKQCWG